MNENTVFKICHKSQMKSTKELVSRKPKLSGNTSYMLLNFLYHIFSNIWSNVEVPPNEKLQALPLLWLSNSCHSILTSALGYSIEISGTLTGPSASKSTHPLVFPSTWIVFKPQLQARNLRATRLLYTPHKIYQQILLFLHSKYKWSRTVVPTVL